MINLLDNSEKKDRPTFRKQCRCAKAKNRDILASWLTSEKSWDSGLKKWTVQAKSGRLVTLPKKHFYLHRCFKVEAGTLSYNRK
jgi:hypothetical protein